VPRVFISYSHDSADHETRVLALAERLRKEGVDAHIDQYVAGTPRDGWPRWMLDKLNWAEFVLVVCTEAYYRRFRGLEEPGKGKGADWEGNLITLEMYDAKSRTTKFVPVLFDSKDERFIPEPVRGHTHYMLDSEDTYAELYSFLTGQAGVTPSELGPLKTLARTRVPPLKFDTPGKRTIHNLPFPPNPLFTGRAAELEALSRGLQQGGATAVMQMVAVHGLGGVGKTQLAVEYAWKHLSNYDAVFWVKADGAAALDVSLAALAPMLGLPEALEREQAVQTKGVLSWLSDHQRWLLIADNVDTDVAKTAVLERLTPSLSGHVLVTSKISDWPVNIRAVRLDPLSPDKATRYLLDGVARRDHNAGDQAAAGSLAEELGNLPIALEQAASFIVEVRWTFDRYRQQLRESRPELLSVAKTWSITLNQLTPLARALLRIAVWWFAIDAIPRSVFAADREVLSGALGEQASVSDLAIDRALGELNRFSLIRLGNETFSVHRLLQAVEQDSLTDEEKKRWRDRAIRLSIRFTSEAERKHLLNLADGRTSNYRGRHSLRSELRHLRWMGLLAMKPGRNIGDIRDNVTGDLSDYVCLTPNGEAWVEVLTSTTAGGARAAGGGF
jgi:SEFIR domain/NB-ARC domain